MKLFGRSGGYWLFWVSALYLVYGLVCVYNKNVPNYAGLLYILGLGMPFAIPPLGRWLNMKVNWDKDMFEWFKNKYTKVGDNCDCGSCPTDNVVKFPEPKAVPKIPEVQPPKDEPAKILYRIGVTDQQRVSFQMGYSEITMNKEGCQQMIDQLTVFMNQLNEYEE